MHGTVGVRKLLGGLAYFVPRLKKIWADAAYHGRELAEWCQQQGAGWELEVIERAPGKHGFSIQSKRWVVERCYAWLNRSRRLAKHSSLSPPHASCSAGAPLWAPLANMTQGDRKAAIDSALAGMACTGRFIRPTSYHCSGGAPCDYGRRSAS